MRIGVIADTHIPDKFHVLSSRIKEALDGVDMILHCGDLVQMEILDELREIAPVEAIAGNHDLNRNLDLPRKRVLDISGYRIGMIHGDELNGLHVNKTQLKEWLYQVLVEPFIYEDGVDLIVFGHYHQPLIESFRVEFLPKNNSFKKLKQDVLIFNPGMPTRNRHLSSIGFIELNKDEIKVELKIFTYPREL
ncbi:MAG: YfcE family phosphodiesterase [Halanaerobiales bacterium]|nr:YfcE family phosphodiesterase [Halanaerobiales bacterium]